MPAQYKQWFGRLGLGLGAFFVALWVASGTASAAPKFTFTGYTNFTSNNAPRPFTLQWTYPKGATCVASGAWTGTKSSSTGTGGAATVSTPGVYRLTCKDATGSAYKDIVVSCATTSQGGLNIYGTVCAQCPAKPTDPQPVVTGSNAQQATCRFTVDNKQYYICNSGTATGVGSPWCGFGKAVAPLAPPATTVTPTPPPACTAPTIKQTTTCNPDGTANVAWSWASTSGATGYEIDISKSSSFSPLLVAAQKTTDTAYVITNQSNGSYYARVRTVGGTATGNCSGTSVWSAVVSATTSCPLPPPPPPALYVSLKANAGDSTACSPNTTFVLSWSATPGATCTATTGNWSPSRGNPQTITFSGTAPVTYGISCTLSDQTMTDSVTVWPK